jgi:hypothetical protein
MQHHMPQKYCSNLPEAARIPALIASASFRAGRMVETVTLREVPFRGGVSRPGREQEPDKLAIWRSKRCSLPTP